MSERDAHGGEGRGSPTNGGEGRMLRVVAGGALALTLAWGVAAAGRVPVSLNGGDEGVIRLSWRLRGAQAERACRKPTPEELEKLPAHMRNPDACVGRPEPYRLEVVLDGRLAAEATIEGAGVRHDRPIYVFREIPAAPGAHRLRVDFRRDESEPIRPHPGEVEEGESLELSLDAVVELAPREVALVTYDADRRRLVLVRDVAGGR